MAQDGYLLFSDIPANQILKWTGTDQTEIFRKDSGNSNGLTFDLEGRLLACEHSNRRISRTEENGEVITLVDSYQGKRLNSPNDCCVRSDGRIFFTDPPYGLPQQQEGKELPFNGVYSFIPGEGELMLIAEDFDRPNGIALSPDEKRLYVADTTRNHVRVFDVGEWNPQMGKYWAALPDRMG